MNASRVRLGIWMRRVLVAVAGAAVVVPIYIGTAGELLDQLTEVRLKVVATYPKIGAVSKITISQTGERLACAVSYREEGKTQYRVFCDGKLGAAFDSVDSLMFSPDGKHLVYVARRGVESTLVYDGEERSHCWRRFTFSPDGKHQAYHGTDALGQPCMVLDGRWGEHFTGLGDPVFSPDGKHLAYQAGTAPQRFVVCDGKKGPPFEEVGVPVFSPDGKSLAYPACTMNRWGIVRGAKRSGVYDGVGKPVFSPDGERLAHKARNWTRWFVVCGGEEQPRYTDVGDPVFSPDGKHLAYVAVEGDRWFVVRDLKEGTRYDKVGTPQFSPDGDRLAYVATREGRQVMVCEGKECGVYDEISWFDFSPDGRHLAVSAAIGLGKFIACDKVPGPPHLQLMIPEQHDVTRGKLRYVAQDREDISLMEVEWAEVDGPRAPNPDGKK